MPGATLPARLALGLRDRFGAAGEWAAPIALVRAVVTRDWRSLLVTLVTCAVAAVVTAFQYQVYTSFVRAGAVGPSYIGGNVWVSAGSIECFDFPAAIGEDYAGLLAAHFPNAGVRRVVFGFAGWTSPSGRRGNVAVIGVDGARTDDGMPIAEKSFIADRSDLARLDLDGAPGQPATLGNETMTLAGTTSQLPTFLGAPYVVTGFEQARTVLRMDGSTAAFLVFDQPGLTGEALERTLPHVQQRYPELTLRSQTDFAASSSRYWQRKTGAGSAILLAAILASLLMMILLANGVSRFLQRYSQDLLSMLGHGGGEREIWLVTGGIAVVVALSTLAAMMVVTPLMIAAARPLLPWVFFVPADALIPALMVILSLGVAIAGARGAVRQFGPEAVFRT